MAQPITLLERDFLAYERYRQDDPEYNALRLSVRRKLAALIEPVKKLAKERGVDLKAQGGLHHPYSFNSFRVREQRAYLCRSDKERKALGSFFGDALGKDAETHYIQTVLELSLDDQVVEAALRIHPQAWWDGQNFKKKCATQDGHRECLTALNALPKGFVLLMHDWKKEYVCGALPSDQLDEYVDTYTPGNHWLHLRRLLRRDQALALGNGIEGWVIESLLALLPVYSFILWRP